LHVYNKNTCPFCEAREELLSSGDAQDKEFAKKYYLKLYVAKVIDRAHRRPWC
jgi:glutaredoxin